MIEILLRFHYDAEETEQFRAAVVEALAHSQVATAEYEVEVVERDE